MAITDNDLIALASLSETDARRVRDMPRGIGPAALNRVAAQGLAKQDGSSLSDYFKRTADGTAVLRNNGDRLENLRLAGKLDIVSLAEILTITSVVPRA